MADFGEAKEREDRGDLFTQTMVGTHQYMAPEVFQGQKYDTSVDASRIGLHARNLFWSRLLTLAAINRCDQSLSSFQVFAYALVVFEVAPVLLSSPIPPF